MKEYGFTITNAGRDLLTKTLAGSQLTITKVMVGNGKLSGQDPAALTDLVSPKHPATATVPKVTDGTVTFTIQYQNQETGMVTINEYGVFAQDPDAGEILLYYATLGDYPQYVMPGQGDIRRFPVSIALSANDVEVNLAFDSSAFISAKDLDTKVSKTGDTMTGRFWFEDAQSDTQLLIATDNGNSRIVTNKKSSSSSDKLLIGCKQMEFINQAPIKNLSTPTANSDAANKKYVDDNAGKRTCRFVVGTSTAGWTKKDCDYLCDGTDDQVEIQAAINALPSTGGEVVVLDGTYNIASSIAINKHNITITGNGSSTVLKKMWDSGSYAIPVLDAKMSNICIKYLQIDGNRAVYQSGFGIASGGSPSNINNKYITIIGVTIKNFRYGVYTSFSKTDVGVFDSVFQNIEEAVSVGGNSDYGHYNSFCIISNNRFLSCRQGASVSYGDYILISNNIIYNDSRSDFCFYATESKFVNITSNICFGGDIGVIISDSYNNVSGNIINNCNTGLRIQGSNSNITGNTCINNNSGIELYSSNKCNVTGNTCIRGTGLSSDYTSTQYTICLKGTNNNYNLIANNNIMGKNYVIEGGTGNTFVNNKYN